MYLVFLFIEIRVRVRVRAAVSRVSRLSLHRNGVRGAPPCAARLGRSAAPSSGICGQFSLLCAAVDALGGSGGAVGHCQVSSAPENTVQSVHY